MRVCVSSCFLSVQTAGLWGHFLITVEVRLLSFYLPGTHPSSLSLHLPHSLPLSYCLRPSEEGATESDNTPDVRFQVWAHRVEGFSAGTKKSNYGRFSRGSSGCYVSNQAWHWLCVYLVLIYCLLSHITLSTMPLQWHSYNSTPIIKYLAENSKAWFSPIEFPIPHRYAASAYRFTEAPGWMMMAGREWKWEDGERRREEILRGREGVQEEQ